MPFEDQKEWEQFFAQWLDQYAAQRLRTSQGILQRTVAKLARALGKIHRVPKRGIPYI